MGWLVAFVVLCLLAFMPIGIDAVYNGGGAYAWLLVGPVRLTLYPRKTQNTNGKKSDQKRKKAGDNFESHVTKGKRSGGMLSELLSVVQIILDFLVDFKRKLRIRNLQFKVILAGEDPCNLAVNYGRTWALLGSLMPQLERHFVIKERNIEAACDFTADETLVNAKVVMSITLAGILSIGVYHGVRILRKYLKILKNSKAVQ